MRLFYLKTKKSAEAKTDCFDNIVKTWTLQEKQNEYLLKLDQEKYDNEISWIDEPENRFHALRSKKVPTRYFTENVKTKREKETRKENNRAC